MDRSGWTGALTFCRAQQMDGQEGRAEHQRALMDGQVRTQKEKESKQVRGTYKLESTDRHACQDMEKEEQA